MESYFIYKVRLNQDIIIYQRGPLSNEVISRFVLNRKIIAGILNVLLA